MKKENQSWYKKKYSNNRILHDCNEAGLTAEEALDYLFTENQILLKENIRLLHYQPPPPIHIRFENFEDLPLFLKEKLKNERQ